MELVSQLKIAINDALRNLAQKSGQSNDQKDERIKMSCVQHLTRDFSVETFLLDGSITG